MSRLAWVLVGALVYKLLHVRDEFEDRLEALEHEADARAQQCDAVTSPVTMGASAPKVGVTPPTR